jgi:hypothetical protein
MTRKDQIDHNRSAFAKKADAGAKFPARQLSAINRHNRLLFDHLGCAQHDRWWYGKAKRVGGLAVHDHLEFGRELHRESARLLAAQNAIDIGGGTTPEVYRF